MHAEQHLAESPQIVTDSGALQGPSLSLLEGRIFGGRGLDRGWWSTKERVTPATSQGALHVQQSVGSGPGHAGPGSRVSLPGEVRCRGNTRRRDTAVTQSWTPTRPRGAVLWATGCAVPTDAARGNFLHHVLGRAAKGGVPPPPGPPRAAVHSEPRRERERQARGAAPPLPAARSRVAGGPGGPPRRPSATGPPAVPWGPAPGRGAAHVPGGASRTSQEERGGGRILGRDTASPLSSVTL